MTAEQIIAFLNALTFGDLGALGTKLQQARSACAELGHAEIADVVGEARSALLSGDLTTYRRKIETAVSRLGHVKRG